MAELTAVLPLDDEAALEAFFAAHGSELAAVIIEPIPANNGLLLQRPEYLQLLQKLCRDHGAQVIDDATGQTMASACTLEKEVRTHGAFDDKKAAAAFVGKLVAQRASEKGIKSVVFDRNGFLYHGRVKALSDGARKVGLDF